MTRWSRSEIIERYAYDSLRCSSVRKASMSTWNCRQTRRDALRQSKATTNSLHLSEHPPSADA